MHYMKCLFVPVACDISAHLHLLEIMCVHDRKDPPLNTTSLTFHDLDLPDSHKKYSKYSKTQSPDTGTGMLMRPVCQLPQKSDTFDTQASTFLRVYLHFVQHALCVYCRKVRGKVTVSWPWHCCGLDFLKWAKGVYIAQNFSGHCTVRHVFQRRGHKFSPPSGSCLHLQQRKRKWRLRWWVRQILQGLGRFGAKSAAWWDKGGQQSQREACHVPTVSMYNYCNRFLTQFFSRYMCVDNIPELYHSHSVRGVITSSPIWMTHQFCAQFARHKPSPAVHVHVQWMVQEKYCMKPWAPSFVNPWHILLNIYSQPSTTHVYLFFRCQRNYC